MRTHVDLFNPLPTVLAHYEQELAATLGRIGIATHGVAPRPAMDDKGSPRTMRLLGHLRAVRRARGAEHPTLILWPSIGWPETALWARRQAATFLVIHDPVAIRRQYGHGGPLRAVARAAATRRGPVLVCHTPDAASATRDALDLPWTPPVALHPFAAPLGAGFASRERVPTVLVAGEYKPTRDLELLRSLGPALRAMGLAPRIIGRGWPPVDGWDVTSEFVPENVLSRALREASAVVVPYARYWQSGIAIRAIESGTPVVGLRTQFLELLLGADSAGLVDEPGSLSLWTEAIESAIGAGPEALGTRIAGYRDDVDASWRTLFSNVLRPPGASL